MRSQHRLSSSLFSLIPMCKCTPSIRTPYCGKLGCEWPNSKPEGARTPMQNSEDIVGRLKYLLFKSNIPLEHELAQALLDQQEILKIAEESVNSLKFLIENFAEACHRCKGSGAPQNGDTQDRCSKCSGIGEIVKDSIICEFHSMREIIAKFESLNSIRSSPTN